MDRLDMPGRIARVTLDVPERRSSGRRRLDACRLNCSSYGNMTARFIVAVPDV